MVTERHISVVIHSHDGTRHWWTDLLGAFPDFSVEFYEVHDMGGT